MVILVVVAVVLLILQTGPANLDEAPVVDQPAPTVSEPTTTTIPFGLFAPSVLVPSESAEWSIEGAHHGVAYVDSLDKVLMFGGHVWPGMSGGAKVWRPSNQTLLIDLETLTAERLDITGPPPRSHHALAYDKESDRVILFGGVPPGEYAGTGSFYEDEYDDTWAFDPATLTWEQMSPEVFPPPSSFYDMVYHSASDRIVLIGRGVWTYDYETDTWEQRSWNGLPLHFFNPGSAVVDESSGLIIAVGHGRSTNPDGLTSQGYVHTFDLDTNRWAFGLGNDIRSNGVASLTYEPTSQRIIGYGDGTVFAYDLATDSWTPIGSGPGLGNELPMLYDPAREQIVVFPTALGEPAGPDVVLEEWQIWTANSVETPVEE
jgi:hypothetical protein